MAEYKECITLSNCRFIMISNWCASIVGFFVDFPFTNSWSLVLYMIVHSIVICLWVIGNCYYDILAYVMISTTELPFRFQQAKSMLNNWGIAKRRVKLDQLSRDDYQKFIYNFIAVLKNLIKFSFFSFKFSFFQTQLLALCFFHSSIVFHTPLFRIFHIPFNVSFVVE